MLANANTLLSGEGSLAREEERKAGFWAMDRSVGVALDGTHFGTQTPWKG